MSGFGSVGLAASAVTHVLVRDSDEGRRRLASAQGTRGSVDAAATASPGASRIVRASDAPDPHQRIPQEAFFALTAVDATPPLGAEDLGRAAWWLRRIPHRGARARSPAAGRRGGRAVGPGPLYTPRPRDTRHGLAAPPGAAWSPTRPVRRREAGRGASRARRRRQAESHWQRRSRSGGMTPTLSLGQHEAACWSTGIGARWHGHPTTRDARRRV
jgi:hypothetical protein